MVNRKGGKKNKKFEEVHGTLVMFALRVFLQVGIVVQIPVN